nr:MAG TPA: hypothetical protein [Caudoviricetes sp.]
MESENLDKFSVFSVLGKGKSRINFLFPQGRKSR